MLGSLLYWQSRLLFQKAATHLNKPRIVFVAEFGNHDIANDRFGVRDAFHPFVGLDDLIPRFRFL